MPSMRSRRATSCGVSSDFLVPPTRSRSSMGLRGQVRSARTNSGIFAPGWFNSRTMAGAVDRSRDYERKRRSRVPPFLLQSAAPLGRNCWGQHTRQRRNPNDTKMILLIAAIAAISGAIAISSNEASARWAGRGWGGGHFAFGKVGVARVGGWGWRGAGWRGAGWRGAGLGWRGPGWGGVRVGRVGGWGWRGPGWGGVRVGGWGWRGSGWGWRRAAWGWGGVGLIGISVGYSCWRWVPTSWGWARVWVC